MNDKYITVSQLTRYIKYKIDNDVNLNEVFLRGEISNFKAHSRGHFYFTLKDEGSRINAVMFASSTRNVKFVPLDGMKVLVTGKISVFEANGGYQIYVNEMIEDGVGNLYVAFEQLKKKLEMEGLFSPEHKKKIPRIPRRVGVVTAPTGAAIKDIISTIKRRWPLTEIILFPALVQGEDAKEDIVKQIKLSDSYDLDTLNVGRGGGSIEDLWAFNEREVADAIFGAKTPLISGPGHEIDMTIADYCADLRAATPSAAVELAVPDIRAVLQQMDDYRDTLDALMERKLDYCRQKYNQYARLLKGHDPAARIQRQRILLQNMEERMHYHINTKLQEEKHRLKLLGSRLTAASPSARLQGGYVFAQDSKERPLSSVTQLNKEQPFDLIFADGFATVKPLQINEIKNEDQ